MGVRVRLGRNTSMYMPFWLAIPLWIIWACGALIVLVVMGLFWLAYGLMKLLQLAGMAIANRRADR